MLPAVNKGYVYFDFQPIESQDEVDINFFANEETHEAKAPKKDMEGVATAVHQYVTEDNLFDDEFRQGGMAVAPPKVEVPSVPSYATMLKKPIEVITHRTGIFGSYCLEDILAIAKLAPNETYECFNYETVPEITMNRSVIYSSASAAHIDSYYQNVQALKKLNVAYTLHYRSVRNDLLQQRGYAVVPKEDWKKFNRFFSQNMIFFNPYFKDAEETSQLIDAFFDYAKTNLAADGIVTLMWNPRRVDSLANVKIITIAQRQGFKMIAKFSGRAFADLTGFKHLKNSTSLEKVVTDCNYEKSAEANSPVVCAKMSDTLVMFKKMRQTSNIPGYNPVASALALLPPSEVDVA